MELNNYDSFAAHLRELDEQRSQARIQVLAEIQRLVELIDAQPSEIRFSNKKRSRAGSKPRGPRKKQTEVTA